MAAGQPERVSRRYGGILFADVHGYSRLMERNEEATHQAVATCFEHFNARAAAFEGEIVHTAGDGFAAFFESVVDAVRFALEIHATVGGGSEGSETRLPLPAPIQFRVGVNLGEVITDRDSIYGESVIIAHRLEELAEPGGICVSDVVYKKVRERLNVGFEYIGPQRLKNMAKTIDAHRVLPDPSQPGQCAPERRPANRETIDEDWLDLQPSVAVMPFRNLSGDPADDFLVDGITEDIITSLSRFRNITVIARNSSFVFKEQAVSIAEICRRLRTHYVVLGSVRKTRSRIRVTIHLVEAGGEKNLWTEQYDRDLGDIFDILDDITAMAVSALAIQIEASEKERIRSQSPLILEAYALVLQGQQRIFRYNIQDNAAARRLYDAALHADPRYARAFAAMSRTHNLDWRYSWSPSPQRSLDHALSLAQQAVELDPRDARGFAELGYVNLYRREHDASISAYERAVRLNPNDADILAEMADALKHSERPHDALPLYKKAMRLNPFYPDQYLWDLAGAHFHLEDYEEVIRTIHQMKNMDEGRRLLAASYAYLGRMVDARREAELIRRRDPKITADYWRQRLPDRSNETAEHFIQGLRMAGL